MNVLLADDDVTSRHVARVVLRSLGHECRTVSDGAQAWREFEAHRPDVVISDWTMPGMTGLELCRNMRKAEKGRDYTYFIMVTGHASADEILEGMSAGADDYLVKPLDTDDLQARLVAADRVTLLHRQLADHRTQLVQLNDRLAHTNDKLRDLDRHKDEFVALVSHELRTPLTSIIGYVDALQRGRAGNMSVSQREALEIVDRNAHRLVRLVGELLNAATVDAGKLTLEPEQVDLAEIISQVVASARPLGEERHVLIELSVAEMPPIVADHARLGQVLDNLISNAIKFSHAGGTVRVSALTDEATVNVEVQDDGIGIPVAEQQQLFTRFFRASTATSREIPGTGLGLSIVRTIVELHGGTVNVVSSKGAGATFTVSLPILEEAHDG